MWNLWAKDPLSFCQGKHSKFNLKLQFLLKLSLRTIYSNLSPIRQSLYLVSNFGKSLRSLFCFKNSGHPVSTGALVPKLSDLNFVSLQDTVTAYYAISVHVEETVAADLDVEIAKNNIIVDQFNLKQSLEVFQYEVSLPMFARFSRVFNGVTLLLNHKIFFWRPVFVQKVEGNDWRLSLFVHCVVHFLVSWFFNSPQTSIHWIFSIRTTFEIRLWMLYLLSKLPRLQKLSKNLCWVFSQKRVR